MTSIDMIGKHPCLDWVYPTCPIIDLEAYQWLEERGEWDADLIRGEAQGEEGYCPIIGMTFKIPDPDTALLFKLTWA